MQSLYSRGKKVCRKKPRGVIFLLLLVCSDISQWVECFVNDSLRKTKNFFIFFFVLLFATTTNNNNNKATKHKDTGRLRQRPARWRTTRPAQEQEENSSNVANKFFFFFFFFFPSSIRDTNTQRSIIKYDQKL